MDDAVPVGTESAVNLEPGGATGEEVSAVRFQRGQIRICRRYGLPGVLLRDVGFWRPQNQDVDPCAIRTGKESGPHTDDDAGGGLRGTEGAQTLG